MSKSNLFQKKLLNWALFDCISDTKILNLDQHVFKKYISEALVISIAFLLCIVE